MPKIRFVVKVGAVLVLAFVFVPTARGAILAAAAVALVATEVRARRREAGRPIALRVDGAEVLVPAGGGTIDVSGRQVAVERVGDVVRVDGSDLRPGEVRFEGSTPLELVR